MKIGAAHVAGKYTYPPASGTQFTDGADVVEDLGLPAFKFYCTPSFATDYPLQTWSGTPTTCTEFLQLPEVAEVLARPAFTDFAITLFAFGNPPNNWWRDAGKADKARLAVEYNSTYAVTVHLLTAYAGTGKHFNLQNWEGDWALMDSVDPAAYVKCRDIDYCLEFHSARQRAVRDAMRATPHEGVSVQYAVEVNRVLDIVSNPGRSRLLKDVLNRLKPDVISLSAYEPCIVKDGYGANQAAWEASLRINLPEAFRIIKRYAPHSQLQLGEMGYEEARIAIDRPSYDVGEMTRLTFEICAEAGCEWAYYWQVFDNEEDLSTPSGVKGYWLKKPDGTTGAAALALADMVD